VYRRAPRAARVHPPIAHTGPAEEHKPVAPGRDVVCRVGKAYGRCRRLADELVRQRLGGLHSAHSVPVSVDFANIEPLQVPAEPTRISGPRNHAAGRLGAAVEVDLLPATRGDPGM